MRWLPQVGAKNGRNVYGLLRSHKQVFDQTKGAYVYSAFRCRSPLPRDPHGVVVFPGSSWDWSGVVPEVAKCTRIVVPDMLGYGRSDKPQTGTFEQHYSLFKQADLYEDVARLEGLTDVVLVAHDMGQSVSAELMKRQQEGTLSF